MEIPQALTFDDVMLVPAASSVLPGDTDTRTRPAQVKCPDVAAFVIPWTSRLS